MRAPFLVACIVALSSPAIAQQDQPPCRILCAPEFNVEPTITVTNLFGSPRVAGDDRTISRERRETEFEIILAVDLPTRISWLGFTAEAIFLPFDPESTPELEFEANVTWLRSERTRGWLSSHFDIVDKLSPAARPDDRRAYTHKLNLELDTSVAIFNWLPVDRWLRTLEVEGSLDYVATGLPQAGDPVDGGRLLDAASPWSFSVVFVIPVGER